MYILIKPIITKSNFSKLIFIKLQLKKNYQILNIYIYQLLIKIDYPF